MTGPQRIRLLVAYDGTDFHGFAANEGVRTVGGTLSTAIARVLRLESVDLTCAGRTDAGVHGWGQVVSFDAPSPVDAARLQAAVNGICGPEIVVRDAAAVDAVFDARHSAKARVYRYAVHNMPVPDPFTARTAWHVPEPLDLRAMLLACDPLIGEHDFSAFCRRPKQPVGAREVSMVRRVFDARWERADDDGYLWFWIEANAFCHQMVRSIVGMLVDVGRGRRRAGEVAGVLRAGDRSSVPNLAPPRGLCLWEVRY